MNRVTLGDILALAFAQKTAADKALYLFKGLVFYPLLSRAGRGSSEDAAAAVSQAGDDIYPLF
jgi:hypothetical protein